MSKNESGYKYQLEALQRALQHSPLGINILIITPRTVILGEQDVQGAIEPVTIEVSLVAKKLDEIMTKYCGED